MSDSGKAVFLSYASQDADAARRIAGALRAAGVEVWFDQSELVGGDAWDQKIRRQIQDCALFVPIVSATTEERHEGYFRLEWDLAEQRTHLMARGVPFLLPVVIDKTNEARAVVPDRFREVQWFKLAGGEPTPDFVARVQRLISQPRRAHVGAEPKAPVAAIHPTAPDHARYDSLPPRETIRVPVWPWIAGAAAAVVAIALIVLRPKAEPATVNQVPNGERGSIGTAQAPSSQTEVQKLIARIWEIYEKQEDGTAADWALADDLGAQAVKLEPNNADAWAAYSQFNPVAQTTTDQAESLRRAQRAIKLAPNGIEPRFALANCYRRQSATLPEAERMLRQLVSEAPNDKRILRVLAYALRNATGDSAARTAEAISLLERAAAVPGGDAMALIGKASVLRAVERYREADEVTEEALKVKPVPAGYAWKIGYQLFLRGDLEGARATVGQVPAAFWLRDNYIYVASRAWFWSRDPKRTLEVLRLLPNDFVEGGSTFRGPKHFLTGQAQQMAGNEAAAQTEWQAALKVVEQRLASQPNDPTLIFWKARLLALLGQTDPAERELRAAVQLGGLRSGNTLGRIPTFGEDVAAIHLLLGRREEVLTALEDRAKALHRTDGNPDPLAIFRHQLSYDPAWDPLRNEPRFQALLK